MRQPKVTDIVVFRDRDQRTGRIHDRPLLVTYVWPTEDDEELPSLNGRVFPNSSQPPDFETGVRYNLDRGYGDWVWGDEEAAEAPAEQEAPPADQAEPGAGVVAGPVIEDTQGVTTGDVGSAGDVLGAPAAGEGETQRGHYAE